MKSEEEDDVIVEFLNNEEDDKIVSTVNLKSLDDFHSLCVDEFEDDRFVNDLWEQLNLIESKTVERRDCLVVNGVKYSSIVDPQLEIDDPHPDIWQLFRSFDQEFFYSELTKHGVELLWSSRIYIAAGITQYASEYDICTIRLSEPLLRLRKRKDLVNTLLHEMIHAFLFVANVKDGTNGHDGHGFAFHREMYRINRKAGTEITVYHSFHDEVKRFNIQKWMCNGVCRFRSPHFGVVRREVDREPGPYDWWWRWHQLSCGGTFRKVQKEASLPWRNVKKSESNICRNPSPEWPESPKKRETAFKRKFTSGDIRDYFIKSKNTSGSNSVAAVNAANTSSSKKEHENEDDDTIKEFYAFDDNFLLNVTM